MIAERSYMLAPTIYPPISDIDPDTLCYSCEGRAFHRCKGHDGTGCVACMSIATAGQFVVRIATARFNHEFKFQTPDLARATAKAEWLARIFSGRLCLGHQATEARVIYKPHMGATVRYAEEVVVRVPIRSRERVAA